MENKKIFIFGNSPFYSQGNLNKLKQRYLNLDNSNAKKKQELSSFNKTIKSKFHFNSKSQNANSIPLPFKKIEKEKTNNFLSCPNDSYFKQLALKQKYINSMDQKLYNLKAIKSFLTTIKYNNIKNRQNPKKDEENKINIYHKENKLFNYINQSKENKTIYLPFNKNNSSKYYNKLNDCFKVLPIPINPEKSEENRNIKEKDKMKLTNNNSWFRKTMKKKKKMPSLPKMKKLNENVKKKMEKIKSKTYFPKTIKNSTIYSSKKNNKNKIKILSSYEVFSIPGKEKGQQKINQNSYLVLPNIYNTHKAKLFGIFDGHGINGDIISQEIRDYFLEFFNDIKKYENQMIFDYNGKYASDDSLEKLYNYIIKNNFKEIEQLFKNINLKLHEKYKNNDICLKSGSTSNLLMILNDKKNENLNKIISINLGDSKSILIDEEDRIIELNKKHIPDDIEEKERIEKNGGEISRVDWADYGPLRIFYKNKIYPGLAMTRAFGDFNAESLGVNTIPDIREYDIQDKKPKIIVLATNGIWQFLSNEKVKNIILPYYEEGNISGGIEKLVNIAVKMWETKNPKFIDDISVILLFFK